LIPEIFAKPDILGAWRSDLAAQNAVVGDGFDYLRSRIDTWHRRQAVSMEVIA
jgi:hypothetical protein